MQNSTLSSNIKKLCKQKRITIKNLLEKCELRKGFIYDLESKDTKPRIDTIEKLADILNVSIDELIGRERNEEEIQKKWNKLDSDEKKIIEQQIDTIIAIKERKQGKLSS